MAVRGHEAVLVRTRGEWYRPVTPPPLFTADVVLISRVSEATENYTYPYVAR